MTGAIGIFWCLPRGGGIALLAHFGLPTDVPFRTDPHYRNSKRLPREQPAA